MHEACCLQYCCRRCKRLHRFVNGITSISSLKSTKLTTLSVKLSLCGLMRKKHVFELPIRHSWPTKEAAPLELLSLTGPPTHNISARSITRLVPLRNTIQCARLRKLVWSALFALRNTMHYYHARTTICYHHVKPSQANHVIVQQREVRTSYK